MNQTGNENVKNINWNQQGLAVISFIFRCDEINANLESTRSKYLVSEQKITELKIALQTAELTSEAKVNQDERQREELLQLRKLNRKLDREISMYKVRSTEELGNL